MFWAFRADPYFPHVCFRRSARTRKKKKSGPYIFADPYSRIRMSDPYIADPYSRTRISDLYIADPYFRSDARTPILSDPYFHFPTVPSLP